MGLPYVPATAGLFVWFSMRGVIEALKEAASAKAASGAAAAAATTSCPVMAR